MKKLTGATACSILLGLLLPTAAWAEAIQRNDGTIIAWGDNDFGQCDVPAPNTDFVAVAAGYYHNLGLRTNGTVIAWGYNIYGQCDVPMPNMGFVAIAAGDQHSFGMKSDGSIVTWGRNNYGQCDGRSNARLRKR